MPQIINTNISSLNAQRNLNKSQAALQVSLQRLSSGLRINGAADDAAGLAISNRFTTQVRGLNQAVRNANDGISFAQTGDGALSEVTNALQRIRELAIQSANDTNSASDRQSLQLEVDQLIAEIDRVAKTTTFNGQGILDGSLSDLQFQVGANANETISVNGVDVRAQSLGSSPGLVQTTTGRISLDNDGVDGGSVGINEAGGNATVLASGEFNINVGTNSTQVDIAAVKFGGNITAAATADLKDPVQDDFGAGIAKSIAERINAIRESGEEDLQGVYASAVTTFVIDDLNAADFSGANVPAANAPANNFIAAGSLDNGDLEINGIDIGPVEFEEDDATGTLVGAINAKSDLTGVTASVNDDGALVLTAEDGRDIVLNVADAEDAATVFGGGNTTTLDAGFTDLRITGTVSISAPDTITIVEANAGEFSATGANATEENVEATGAVRFADVTTQSAANQTIGIIDGALTQVDSARANFGAISNRFNSTIANLENVSEQLSAARSRILDADFAQETASLTRSQILQQAGISVLAQANAIPQQVLALLQ